jgi:hypothetical protein
MSETMCTYEHINEFVNCRFWDEEVPFTPESRVAVHEHMKKLKQKEDQKKYVRIYCIGEITYSEHVRIYCIGEITYSGNSHYICDLDTSANLRNHEYLFIKLKSVYMIV